MAAPVIDTVPIGTPLTVQLNGRSLGIVETNPEFAFSYWGQRQRKASNRRRYTLAGNGQTFVMVGDQWRAA